MAFGAKKIFPIDTRPGTAVGISIPFNSPAVFFLTYTTKDAIRNNLLNFFLTNQTERYLNNEFGANLRKFIFEQITTGNLNFLKQNIQESLNSFFPNVVVEALDIIPIEDNNQVDITLKYSIKDTGINDNIQVTFS